MKLEATACEYASVKVPPPPKTQGVFESETVVLDKEGVYSLVKIRTYQSKNQVEVRVWTARTDSRPEGFMWCRRSGMPNARTMSAVEVCFNMLGFIFSEDLGAYKMHDMEAIAAAAARALGFERFITHRSHG
jgi:hypothetical protein